MDRLLLDRNFIGAACERVQSSDVKVASPWSNCSIERGFGGRKRKTGGKEKKWKRKSRGEKKKKKISSCYEVQQQPAAAAGKVTPEIKCESCGSISEEDVRLCRKEKFLVPDPIWSGGKTTNLVYECNVCETTGTILMVPGEGQPLPSTFAETGDYTTIMVFDCDGVEPVRFSLDKTPWEAQFMLTEYKINYIYISDEEFADCREHDNEIVPVAIWKAKAKFVKSE